MCQFHRERNMNLSEEEKEKEAEYMRSYYLEHKKYLLSWFVNFWGPEETENPKHVFYSKRISKPIKNALEFAKHFID